MYKQLTSEQRLQIFALYQPDNPKGIYKKSEIFPLWQLAEYKRLIDSLEKGFEIVDTK